MRLADERFSASIMMSISMIESLTGEQQDWMRNTSAPRTFSSTRTRISPSLKEDTVAAPRGRSRYEQIACASAGLALPEKSLSSLFIPPLRCGTWRCRCCNDAGRVLQNGGHGTNPLLIPLTSCTVRTRGCLPKLSTITKSPGSCQPICCRQSRPRLDATSRPQVGAGPPLSLRKP